MSNPSDAGVKFVRRYRQSSGDVFNLVKTLSMEYSETAYQERNQWMVDHSSKVIAVYDGKAGGTRNTISYARKNKVFVKYLKG